MQRRSTDGWPVGTERRRDRRRKGSGRLSLALLAGIGVLAPGGRAHAADRPHRQEVFLESEAPSGDATDDRTSLRALVAAADCQHVVQRLQGRVITFLQVIGRLIPPFVVG